jgi:hypothetical protein
MRTYFMVYDASGNMVIACSDCVERHLPSAMCVETLFTLDDIDHIHQTNRPMFSKPARRSESN